MTEHFPEPLWVPHSRYNDLPEQALADCGYKILTRSSAAGVDAFAKQDGSFFLFFQGHPEYEADTLLREYRRDVARFLAGEREHYPQMPLGYFNDDATALGEAFRTLAQHDRRSELIAEFPKSSLEAGLQCPWRAAARGIYEKWCAYLSARKTERRTGRAFAGGAAAPDLARLAARRAPAGPQFSAVSAAETLGIYALFGTVAI